MNAQHYSMHGGLTLEGHKLESTRTPIATIPLPKKLTIPIRQNFGALPRCVVHPGDHVLKGQPLALPMDPISAAVHAPTSGIIAEVTECPVPHISGLTDHCIILKPDGLDESVPIQSFDWREADGDEIRQAIRAAGVVGLGGAVFPSDMKIYPTMEVLVINGAECEPYITCDDMLMREHADDVVSGVEILSKATQAKKAIIGIESDKLKAAETIKQALAKRNRPDITVHVLPARYPSGYAKQLIYLLTGIKVPSGVNSYQRGVQCFNVATAYSICRALMYGEPQISRIVTVTGNVENPRNYRVLIGTPIAELLNHAQLKPDTNAVLFGGPMMGFPIQSDEMPVTKACTCLLAASEALFPVKSEMPCIRCGSCASVCPVSLLPYQLMGLSRAERFHDTKAYHLFDCIECGCCAYVCPSDIPLVNYFRFAKSALRAEAQQEKAAIVAKANMAEKAKRAEIQAQARANRMAQRARPTVQTAETQPVEANSATQPAKLETESEKQAAIQAALERVKQKRLARQNAAQDSVSLNASASGSDNTSQPQPENSTPQKDAE